MSKGLSGLLQKVNAKILHAQCSLDALPSWYRWEEREEQGTGLSPSHDQPDTCVHCPLCSHAPSSPRMP